MQTLFCTSGWVVAQSVAGNEVCVKNVKKRLLEAEVGERCCIIGTLFKKMELKPSILKEISTSVRQFLLPSCNSLSLSLSLSLSRFVQHHLLSQPPRAKLTSSSDQLVVEDSSQRFPLSGNIPSPHLVTGIIIVCTVCCMDLTLYLYRCVSGSAGDSDEGRSVRGRGLYLCWSAFSRRERGD